MATIINGDGIVTAEGTSTTQGRLRLGEDTDNGSNYVELQAPASVASNITFTLPSADGTNGQVLQTNGSGTLSFTGSPSLTSPLAIAGNSTAGAEIRLPEDTDNGSNYVALKAANSLASNLTFTLPSADGTSGQVLQTNGSGVLSFATPASALNLVATATATNGASTFDLTSGFTSTYETYMLVATGLKCSANQGSVEIRVEIGGSFVNTGYNYFNYGKSSSSTNQDQSSTNGGAFYFSTDMGGGASEGSLNFVMYFYKPSSTTDWKSCSWSGTVTAYEANANNQVAFFGGGAVKNTGALTGVRLTPGSRTMVSGTYRLYGLANS